MSTGFSVRFDGELVDDGSIPVRDLAPALIALGEVAEEVHLTAHPGQQPIGLHIKATEQGSFIVELIVHQTVADQVRDLFTSETADATANVVTFLTTLFALVFWLKRRLVASSEKVGNGMVRITTEDGDSIEVPSAVADSARKLSVRTHMEQAVSPVKRDGISMFSIYADGAEPLPVTVTPATVSYFDAPEPAATRLSEKEVETHLAVVAPNFKGDKWRFSEGDGSSFFASIADLDFNRRVDRGESFQKGDVLQVRMLVRQEMTEDGNLATERTVLSVLNHTEKPEQGGLF